MICVSVLPLLRQAAAVLLLQPQASQRAAFEGCLSRVRCVDGVAAIDSTSFIQVRRPGHGSQRATHVSKAVATSRLTSDGDNSLKTLVAFLRARRRDSLLLSALQAGRTQNSMTF